MTHNFEQMTNQELIAYSLKHRDDLEALRVLYHRRTPDEQVTIYPAVSDADGNPIEENIKIMEEAINRKIKHDN